ncbi:hypothetical protein H4582DRAFT_2080442 [Lactarius indigo]|nr:hypothetical protein H4582DRAFT_2080442 [Lactarius indigo]
MSFDLHALLDNVWFPCLRAHALDILAPEGPSNARVLEALVHIRGEALRRLVVSSFESTAILIHAVRLFPCMRWLRLIAVNFWYEQSPITRTPVHLGEWVEVLAVLPEVEAFRGASIFRDPESTTIKEYDELACDILSFCLWMRQVELPHGRFL